MADSGMPASEQRAPGRSTASIYCPMRSLADGYRLQQGIVGFVDERGAFEVERNHGGVDCHVVIEIGPRALAGCFFDDVGRSKSCGEQNREGGSCRLCFGPPPGFLCHRKCHRLETLGPAEIVAAPDVYG